MSEPDPTLTFQQASPATATSPAYPAHIGRYRIEKSLGKGGFGNVYLAHDQQLDRLVAIKIPHAELVAQAADAELYLNEARTVAHLDHPHIVPVYDVGSTADYPCFVVSKYVAGGNLAALIKRHRPNQLEAVGLVATIAEALHHAHRHGIVHRDVKPGNILIDAEGSPHIVDFGLALREHQFGQGTPWAGTPSYMSPEQARGEGHRVDGRSDIFSLGVIFYILLVGRKPFHADSEQEVLNQIITLDPRPPRQVDDTIPRELERICLKAMAKRATERYTTAKDLADDLRYFQSQHALAGGAAATASGRALRLLVDAEISGADSTTADTGGPPLRVVPKGLRSFDRHDSDFFLELLPGPRDRLGLPDQIRFWKARIEEPDGLQTFAVGLLYGPSGCGKSSLLRAGLLPRLAPHVTPLLVEATGEDTETRLLNVLRKSFPTLPTSLTLAETTAALRSGPFLASGQKVLIVMDQFEQWLHAKKVASNTELVQALRQCDGGKLQCLALVRDDFWLAATRFMAELEIDLLQGRNTAMADLFDLRHAKKVLAAFGRAFGVLPEQARQMSSEQKQFLEQAVESLAQDERVMCVRLALFAEMVKGRPWTPATLKEVGGAEGVGVAFLEETFGARTANPQHRLHQHAARAVLKALLPESGTNIKGNLRSSDELLQASGYTARPHDFADLLRILDRETRLITPTDPGGGDSVDESASRPPAGQKYYQLTHDYLVPSLRDWLTRKQKETRRGRAELQLAERAALWTLKPENRRLPSAWESVNIACLTNRKTWTEPQRKMMAKAVRLHAARWGTVLGVVVAAVVGVQFFLAAQRRDVAAREKENDRQRAELLADAVLTAPPEAVPYVMRNLDALRDEAVAILSQRFENGAVDPAHRLRAAMALAEYGTVQHEFLIASIDIAPPGECANIVAALGRAREQALPLLRERSGEADRRQDWRQKAKRAIVAAQLGDAAAAQDMLRQRPDPIQRTVMIETLPTWSGDVGRQAEVAATIDDAALRSGICLGLGAIVPDDLPQAQRSAAAAQLLAWHQHDPDAAVHSASGWALRQWNVPIPPPAVDQPADRDWYVNHSGLTMIRIPAGSFRRRTSVPRGDDPATTIEKNQTVTLSHPFWLGDREVSVGLFQQFVDDPKYPSAEKPTAWEGPEVRRSPTPEHPTQAVSWVDAVLFCNWLSKREGRAPCYVQQDAQWQLVPNADGYRLPFESEWEYACRAGTTTRFASGEAVPSLAAYAVVLSNHTEPCGHKLPNGWGVFDAHGNVYEWCHDWHDETFGIELSVTDPHGPATGDKRVLRGGAFDYDPRYAGSAARESNRPTYRSPTIGFRVALSSP